MAIIMVRINRYLKYIIFSVIFTNSVLFSDIANAANAEEKNISGARDYVTRVSEDILEIVNDVNISEQEKENYLSKLFDAHVDTGWMGQFILGKYNRTITDAQRNEYIPLYHEYLKRSYIPKFKLYSGENYNIIRAKDKGRDNFLVKVAIVSDKANSDVNVDYRLNYKDGKGFVIRDIVGEGVSLIVTQRSDFGAMIKKKGIEFFIKKLSEKVESMGSSTITDDDSSKKDKIAEAAG